MKREVDVTAARSTDDTDQAMKLKGRGRPWSAHRSRATWPHRYQSRYCCRIFCWRSAL